MQTFFGFTNFFAHAKAIVNLWVGNFVLGSEEFITRINLNFSNVSVLIASNNQVLLKASISVSIYFTSQLSRSWIRVDYKKSIRRLNCILCKTSWWRTNKSLP